MPDTKHFIDSTAFAARSFSPTNTFKTTKIVCFTNLHKADAPIIPIGVLGEVNFLHIRGYGLYARSRLTPYEQKLLPEFVCKLLDDPMSFLRSCVRPYFDEMENNVSIRGHLIELLQTQAGTVSFVNNIKHPMVPFWCTGEHEEIKASVQESLRAAVASESTSLDKEALKLIEHAESMQNNKVLTGNFLKEKLELKDFEYSFRIAA